MGMGNLADELDQLDDEEDEGEDVTDATMENGQEELSPVDGARDSGIDVSYAASKRKTGASSPTSVRNFSKPFGAVEKPPDEGEEEEDKLNLELEDAMNSIARMASYSSTSEDPLIPRTIALLQDLGNQTGLEVGAQRLTTSTNSLTSHLSSQGKSLQTLMTSLYSPFVFSPAIDLNAVEELAPLVESLLKDLPVPDPLPLQGLQKLDRESHMVLQTLSQLTDTLQMGRQTTNAASRHLRITQSMVGDLRRERERADIARHELSKSEWNDRIRDRWCGSQCRDIMGGFERLCDDLRKTLVQAGTA